MKEESRIISTTPLVSILMTAYNREKYIAEAIESVLASDYTNFELIIVDDCSKDNTVAIVKEFATKDTRIKLFINEKNLGDYNNRNRAASYAKGKYLKYLDSDDKITVNGLMKMVNAIESYPGAAIAMMWVYDNSVTQPVLCTPEKALREFFIDNRGLMVGPSGCIYSSDIFSRLGGFSGRPYISDFEFNMKCALVYSIVKMENGLIFYRVHDEQQTSEAGHSKTYRTWLYKIQNDVLADILCPLNESDKLLARKKIDRLQARRVIFHFFKKFNLLECYSMVKESGLGWRNFFKGLISFR